MHKSTQILFLIGLLLLFLPTLQAFADNATPLNTNVGFQDVGDSTFVKWSLSLVSINGNYTCPFVCPGYSKINFTNIAVTSKTNPSQTFGTEIQNANSTITNIDINNVYYTVVPKSATNPNLFHYYPSINVPPVVSVGSLIINQTNYLTNPALYPPCVAPCIYQSSSFLEIKTPGSVNSAVDVCTSNAPNPCIIIGNTTNFQNQPVFVTFVAVASLFTVAMLYSVGAFGNVAIPEGDEDKALAETVRDVSRFWSLMRFIFFDAFATIFWIMAGVIANTAQYTFGVVIGDALYIIGIVHILIFIVYILIFNAAFLKNRLKDYKPRTPY